MVIIDRANDTGMFYVCLRELMFTILPFFCYALAGFSLLYTPHYITGVHSNNFLLSGSHFASECFYFPLTSAKLNDENVDVLDVRIVNKYRLITRCFFATQNPVVAF